MKFYKDVSNKVYAFESDGSQDDFIPSTLTKITKAQADSLRSVTALAKTVFTSLEFLDRFTDAEQLAVVTATLQNPQVKLWYDRMLAASFVDLADERVAAGIDALIGVGLIAANRKAALLAPVAV